MQYKKPAYFLINTNLLVKKFFELKSKHEHIYFSQQIYFLNKDSEKTNKGKNLNVIFMEACHTLSLNQPIACLLSPSWSQP